MRAKLTETSTWLGIVLHSRLTQAAAPARCWSAGPGALAVPGAKERPSTFPCCALLRGHRSCATTYVGLSPRFCHLTPEPDQTADFAQLLSTPSNIQKSP